MSRQELHCCMQVAYHSLRELPGPQVPRNAVVNLVGCALDLQRTAAGCLGTTRACMLACHVMRWHAVLQASCHRHLHSVNHGKPTASMLNGSVRARNCSAASMGVQQGSHLLCHARPSLWIKQLQILLLLRSHGAARRVQNMHEMSRTV